MTMTGTAVVLDSGVLDQATTDRTFRNRVLDLARNGRKPLIPTVVLAEAITGRPQDAPTNLTIRRFDTIDTPQATARRAGILRYRTLRSRMQPPPSGIDAIVAAHAVDADAEAVFTTDPDDLQWLLAGHPRIRVEKP